MRAQSLAAVMTLAVSMFVAVTSSACGSTERTTEPSHEPPPREAQTRDQTQREPDRGALEQVTFAASDGLTLVGSLRRAEPGAPALILLHQLSSNRGEWSAILEALPEDVTILSFDMRGHGASIDRNGQVVGWRAFATADWRATIDDVATAIEYLKRETGAERFVLGGASIGSSAALLTAVDHAEVVGVFALSPGRAYRGLDTITPAQSLSDRRLLFVAAEGEAPAKEAAEELARLTGGQARIVGGNAHGVRMVGAAPDLPADLARFVSSSLEAE